MSTNKKSGGEEAAAAPDPPDLSGDLAPWTLASLSHDDVLRRGPQLDEQRFPTIGINSIKILML